MPRLRPTPEAILFDIDGTLLVDSSDHLAHLLDAIGAEQGHLPALRMDGERPLIDERDMSGWIDGQVVDELLTPTAEARERVISDYVARFRRALASGASSPGTAVPALLETLHALASRGIRLGLSTGNVAGAAWAKVERIVPRAHEVFEDPGELGAVAGTRADVVSNSLRLMNLDTDRDLVWVIGDTTADMTAARATGAVPIGVLTGAAREEELREAGAEHVVPDVAALPALIDSYAS